ncbi:hypothetical protein GCM10011613_15790 [Cellvibrio zantedeschiae]|uniref:Uncharacterized protein n=1 Tax=Cellvibrio zantedeschiae TaxID=1237077 RepID=A0ABQ3AZP3_9GAMM|nr:hypothetical protein [Cellvibrio zantedeschiae]GGY71760.1 hypothetical protein GCM10011613_15790 [Cellvibrio zantedeschiae]
MRFLKARPLSSSSLLLITSLLISLTANAADKIPKLNGHPDLSGIWQTTSAADYDLEPHSLRADAPPSAGIVEGGVIPYLPKALAQKKKNFENRLMDDPRLKGWTLGVPRGIYYPEPFQIFQRDRDITVFHQFGHSVRTIHTNNTQHPEDPNDWWFGDSRGHWEKDTLVVDVKHFNDGTWLDRAGNFHSDALHVVERWKLLDANTIEYKATIEDEKVFSRPWNISVILHRHREPNFQLIEDYRYTLEYDKYYPYPAESAPAKSSSTAAN